MTDPSAADALAHFKTLFSQKQQMKGSRQKRNDALAAQKAQTLIPIRQLIQELVDLGVRVRHAHASRGNGNSQPDQLLEPYENESSESWLPGTSIYLDHPAQIEIAVPNPHQVEEQGVVVVRVASDHPDAAVVRGPFTDVGQACMALAEFLARNTRAVDPGF